MFFNILITSISKKIPQLNAVKKSLTSLNLYGDVWGGDCSSLSLSRYFVDNFWLMPSQEKLTIDDVINFCKINHIKLLIPTRDGELLFYAQYREFFKKNGIFCMISSFDAIKTCCDKLIFCRFLRNFGFNSILTSKSIEDITSSRFVVKEQFGAGSKAMGLNLTKSEAQAWATSLKNPLFQPYIEGDEYSIDLYLDQLGKTKGVIARKRDVVVNGESQMTTSVRDSLLENLCANVAEKIGLTGHCVFQVIKDSKNHYHMIECNPRWGGASTLSLAMGLKSFEWFILEILNKPLPDFIRSLTEKRQIRYATDLIVDQESI